MRRIPWSTEHITPNNPSGIDSELLREMKETIRRKTVTLWGPDYTENELRDLALEQYLKLVSKGILVLGPLVETEAFDAIKV